MNEPNYGFSLNILIGDKQSESIIMQDIVKLDVV